MNTFFQDIRYGLRTFRKSPGFTIVALLCLALGIGSNVTIFSLVNSVLLSELPGVENPERLVTAGRTNDGEGWDSFSYADYAEYRNRNNSFSDLVAFSTPPMHVASGGESVRVPGALVSGNYFSALGVKPFLGRFIGPEDDRTRGGHPVVVLSYGLWQRSFGANPAIVGRETTINGLAYTVIGIAPREFRGTDLIGRRDAWVPMMMVDRMNRRGSFDWLGDHRYVFHQMFGRLKPGVTPEQAQSEMTSLARQLEEQFPESNRGRGVVVAAGLGMYPPEREALWSFMTILMVVVGLVLLVACANVANLLLSWASTRRREIGVRMALGAKRSRLIRQLLTESVMLFFAGGFVGFLLSYWTTDLIRLILTFSRVLTPGAEFNMSPDLRVLALTFFVSLVTGTVFGVFPALRASNEDVAPVLKDGTNGGRVRGARMRSVLVVGQMAMSIVLLVAAGLFVRTLQQLRAIDSGFDTDHVVIASADLIRQGYSNDAARLFFARVLENVRPLPGVASASLAAIAPLTGSSLGAGINVEGFQPPEGGRSFQVDFNVIAPEYFETMGLPLIQGRDFTDRDRAGSSKVVIVNKALAGRFWPNGNAIGQRVTATFGEQAEPFEIVGVSANAKYRSLREAEPRLYAYVPFQQLFESEMALHVRAAGDPEALIPAIRGAIASLDPNLPLFGVGTLRRQLGRSIERPRVAATLIGVFGFIALVIAAAGLYGAMAFLVGCRTKEIGVRMALGARRADVLRMVIRQAMFLSILGATIGLAASLGLTRLIAAQLFGVTPRDPLTFVIAPLVLFVAALLASFVPARRATKVDPLIALRYE